MNHAALSIAVALAVGVLVQALAMHINVPGIVLLLVTGILLGPDGVGLVRPQDLGGALQTLVGFAVAVILFEGGMNLRIGRLRIEQKVIRRLVTEGAAVTAVCSALVAGVFMGWDFRTAALFGTLVIVTGPTVVTPLLRRIHVNRNLKTILEAEGVIIDAVGAVVAVVALEIALAPSGRSFAMGLWGLGLRFGAGIAVGCAGGFLIALLLRADRVVPERLENVLSLSLALATFEVSNAFKSESGIVAAIVAGMVVGNARTRVHRDLLDFKEQLTMMFIGMLFVLLSADVRREELLSLGSGGIATVLAMMFVIRPLGAWLSTRGTDLRWQERAFIAWLAPRGIVAAAVAGLFAQTLGANGLPGGEQLRAMVFLVIGATVVVQGLPAALVARWLGVRQAGARGYVIIGANPLARLLGRALTNEGIEVLHIDADPNVARKAEEDGLKVMLGSALEERTLQRASLDTRQGLVALTQNEGVNLLCARKARDDFRMSHVHAAIDRRRIGISSAAGAELGVDMIFGAPRDLKHWVARRERDALVLERWRLSTRGGPDVRGEADKSDDVKTLLLPLLFVRGKKVQVVDDQMVLRSGDVLVVAIDVDKLPAAHAWLVAAGWEPCPSASAAGGSSTGAGSRSPRAEPITPPLS